MRVDREQYMKADAEGKAKLVAKAYGLSGHQMWLHKQSGKYIINHAGIQTIAAVEGILVNYRVINADGKSVAVEAIPYVMDGSDAVYGQATFGEASPENNKMAYPYAMAEKRGFDRAVLIHVLRHVGGYGGDFYGEDEADDFKQQPAAGKKTTTADKKPSITFEQARDALKQVSEHKNLLAIKAKMKDMDIDYIQKNTLRDLYLAAQDRVKASEAA